MKKNSIISILLIILVSFGFVLSLQSSQAAMGMESGMSPGCLEHCLTQAAPYSQQNTIVPLILLFFTAVFLAVVLIIYARSQVLGYRPKIIFDPLYLFKTVVLRE